MFDVSASVNVLCPCFSQCDHTYHAVSILVEGGTTLLVLSIMNSIVHSLEVIIDISSTDATPPFIPCGIFMQLTDVVIVQCVASRILETH